MQHEVCRGARLPLRHSFAMALSMQSAVCGVKVQSQVRAKPARSARMVTRAAAVSGDVPDMGKRQLMNALLLGAVGAPVTALAGGFAYFFVPPSCVPDHSPRGPDSCRKRSAEAVVPLLQGWRVWRWPGRPRR